MMPLCQVPVDAQERAATTDLRDATVVLPVVEFAQKAGKINTYCNFHFLFPFGRQCGYIPALGKAPAGLRSMGATHAGRQRTGFRMGGGETT